MEFSWDTAKNLLKYPFSRQARKHINTHNENIKLIMTLVVKNEEEIIEKNIRFHALMGVDGFIVSSHNSTDNTNRILENLRQEGLVLEILHRTSLEHQHSYWVNEMVNIAKTKYGATWIINADADEFYYSQSLDLKASIRKEPLANVLWIDSLFLFPDDRKVFLNCPYFVTRPLQIFESEMLGVNNNELYLNFIGSQGCTKVVHRTNGFVSISDGNHDVQMKRKKRTQSADIRLYHYHIRNYKGYEEKVIRWLDTAHLMPQGQGIHMKEYIEIYEKGGLREHYDSIYGERMRIFLLENGVVSIDKSVPNFLTYNQIL